MPLQTYSTFVIPPFACGNALEEDEPLAIDDFILDGGEEYSKSRQWEQIPPHPSQRCARRNKVVCSLAKLRDFVIAEEVGPSFGVVLIVFRFPYRLAFDLEGELTVRP